VHLVVINLDRDRTRLKTVSAEFARSGLAFERFPAVDGLAVPEAARRHFFHADGRPTLRLTRGEIGCYASHLTLWQRVAQGHYPATTLICEDDIRLPENFADILNAVLSSAPVQWDIIRLSSPTTRIVWQVRNVCEGYQLVHYSKIPSLLGAYLVSQQGARKLLQPGLRTRPVDLDMARPWELDLNLYGVDPAPVYQPTKNASSIDAVEKRYYASRAKGFLGIPSRLLGRDRICRYRHNARTVGPCRTAVAEILNAFRDRPKVIFGRRGQSPKLTPDEVPEV
jgi:glycosyl transferase family 25